MKCRFCGKPLHTVHVPKQGWRIVHTPDNGERLASKLGLDVDRCWEAATMSKKNKKMTTTTPAPATATVAEPKVADPKKQAAKLRKEAKVLDTHGNSAKAAELRAEADALDPKPAKVAKPKPEPRPVCDQQKKDGSACTARAMQGATYCTDHRPAEDHLKPEELDWFRTLELFEIVRLFGWGKVRQAYKNAHPAAEATKAE